MIALADRIPNQEAIALSPTIGWLMLACATCVVAFFMLQSDRWRRWWLRVEDPRSLGLFRIVFALFVISNVNDLWEHFNYLFTDEGIFTADVARQVHASAQFRGFGDGFGADDPWGFFDPAGIWEFLEGPKYSLLYFWDTPTFFWAHLVVFELCGFLFLVGLWTRPMGVLTWFLMNSLFFRNHLFWEGTELVYRCFLTYLILARSGHAYSVDNWLRCRRLRKQGRLSERGGPGGGAGVAPSEAHPRGLQAIYRLIPAWPRRLMMLQLATLYLTTGLLKTGSVWWHGDPLYYALNLDHFYRLPPQLMSSLFGTNVFRIMSYAVKVGQSSFALIIVGLVARWAIRERLAPLDTIRKWGVRISFALALVFAGAIAFTAWPVHFTPINARTFAGIWLAAWAVAWFLWWRLGNRPFHVSSLFGLRRFENTYVLDRAWFCRWFLGRRILLVWHVAFHAHIITLMNVGHFQTGMLSATIVFLEGHEIARILRAIGRRLGTWGVKWIPADVTAGEAHLPAEDPTLPHLHHDGARLPQWALAAGLGLVLVGIIVRSVANPTWDWRWIWVGAAVFLAGVGFQRWRASRESRLSAVDPDSGAPRTPWAYGPLGRFLIGSLVIWHLVAVATWLMPDKDSLQAFRGPARQVFSVYLHNTTTDQGWGMFAPNPPRSNVFLKVLVTDGNGETWDMRTDVYASERKPIPWIWNDRIRKMNRRIIGGESGPTQWYRKWHARWHCRNWALTHGGETPEKVDLIKMWYQIPSPEHTRERGYYVAEELLERTGHEELSYTEYCKNGIMGQLPNYIRERHGLPPLPEDTPYRPWIKNKKRKWDARNRARQPGSHEKARP